MKRYRNIETLMAVEKLEIRSRMRLLMAFNKLSEEERSTLDGAIALLISESAIIGHLSAQGRQQA